jgi:hypothetical protein
MSHPGAPRHWQAAQRVEELGLSRDLAGAEKVVDKLQEELVLLKQALAPHRRRADR